MKLLKIISVSLVILVPLAWLAILILGGGLIETIESIFLGSVTVPVILGCFSLIFLIKGIKKTFEQRKYSNNISLAIFLTLISLWTLLLIIKNAWSIG